MPKPKSLFSKGTFKRSVDQKQTKEINKLKKTVKSLTVVRENKFFDSQWYGSATTTPTVFCVNKIGVADQDGTVASNNANLSKRIGKRLQQTHLMIKGQLYNSPLTTSPDNWCMIRMLVVIYPDLIPTATLDNVLNPVSGLVGGSYMLAHKNRMPRTPYQVIYDKKINLSSMYQSEAQQYPVEPWRRDVNITIPIKGQYRDVRWAEDESVSGPTNNGIAVYIVSDSGTISHPSYALNFRLRYKDA